MISKGIGDIKGLQTLHTRPGPMTEKTLLLKLYKLATYKANFQKKKEWAERQRFQAIRNLTDIQREIGRLKDDAMEKIGSVPSEVKQELGRAGSKRKQSEVSLKY